MPEGTPFLFGPEEKNAIRALDEEAARNAISFEKMRTHAESSAGTVGVAQNSVFALQTIELPFGYTVTITHEEQPQPLGMCRHLSIASPDPDRVPLPQAVQMVLEAAGFKGRIDGDRPTGGIQIWLEPMRNGGAAINILEPVFAGSA